MAQTPSITLHSVSFNWPDGSTALHEVNGSFPTGSTGLVGANGSGKSTLLELITGTLQPTSGHLEATGAVAYLPRNITLDQDLTVAGLLGATQYMAKIPQRSGAGHGVCRCTPSDAPTLVQSTFPAPEGNHELPATYRRGPTRRTGHR